MSPAIIEEILSFIKGAITVAPEIIADIEAIIAAVKGNSAAAKSVVAPAKKAVK